ncbi:hypothetical protein Hanom_Chr13g01184301 [Helianthus anomalus]
MHIRGPPPNGIYKPSPGFVAFETPSENLSGLNSLASSPQISLSWWKNNVFSWMIVPAGNVTLPSLASSYMSRLSTGATGYSLRTSFNIMFICDSIH